MAWEFFSTLPVHDERWWKWNNGTSTGFGPYENIKQDFSHEEWIVDKVAGVFNVGTPNFVRIGYGKKSKSKKVIEGFSDVDLDKRSLMTHQSDVGGYSDQTAAE